MANRKDRLFSIEVPVWAAVAAVLLFSVAWPVLITFSVKYPAGPGPPALGCWAPATRREASAGLP